MKAVRLPHVSLLFLFLLSCSSELPGGQSGSELECQVGDEGDSYCRRLLGEEAVCVPPGICELSPDVPDGGPDGEAEVPLEWQFDGMTRMNQVTGASVAPRASGGYAALVSSNFEQVVVNPGTDDELALDAGDGNVFDRNPLVSIFDSEGRYQTSTFLGKFRGSGTGFAGSGKHLVRLADGGFLATGSFAGDADLGMTQVSTPRGVFDGVNYTAEELLVSQVSSEGTLMKVDLSQSSTPWTTTRPSALAAHPSGDVSIVTSSSSGAPVANATVQIAGEELLSTDSNRQSIVRFDGQGNVVLNIAVHGVRLTQSVCNIGEDLLVLGTAWSPAGESSPPYEVSVGGAPVFTYSQGGMVFMRLASDGTVKWHRMMPGSQMAATTLACGEQSIWYGITVKASANSSYVSGSYLGTIDSDGSNALETRVGDADSGLNFHFAEIDGQMMAAVGAYALDEYELFGEPLPDPESSDERVVYLFELGDDHSVMSRRLIARNSSVLDLDLLASGQLLVSLLSYQDGFTTIEPNGESLTVDNAENSVQFLGYRQDKVE